MPQQPIDTGKKCSACEVGSVVAELGTTDFGPRDTVYGPGQGGIPTTYDTVSLYFCAECGAMFKFPPGEPNATVRIIAEYQRSLGPTSKDELSNALLTDAGKKVAQQVAQAMGGSGRPSTGETKPQEPGSGTQ